MKTDGTLMEDTHTYLKTKITRKLQTKKQKRQSDGTLMEDNHNYLKTNITRQLQKRPTDGTVME